MTYLMGAGLVLASLIFGIGVSYGHIGRWTVIHAGAIVGVAVWAWYALKGDIRIPRLLWAGLPLAVVAVLSLAWSADWRNGLDDLKDFFALAVWAMAVPFIKPGKLPVFIAVAVVGVLGLLYLVPVENSGFGNQNFIAEYMLMAWPFTILLAVRNRRMIPIPGIVAFYLLTAPSFAPLGALALTGAAGMAVVCWKFIRWKGLLAWGVVITGLMVAVWHHPEIQESLLTRAELFINSFYAWGSAPLLGHGVGSFDYIYPLFAERHTEWIGDITLFKTPWLYAGQAHNEILQIMVETGLLGLMAVMSFPFMLGRMMQFDKFTAEQYAALACLTFAFALSMFGFPLRNPATGLLAAVSMGILFPDYQFRLVRWWRLAAIPALCVAGVLGYASVSDYRAEMSFNDTRNYIVTDPVRAFQGNLAAYQEYPYARRYRHQLILSMQAMAASNDVRVTNVAIDQIYEIALSAGANASVMMARLEFLLSSGAHADTNEDEQLIAELKRRARLQDATKAYAAVQMEMSQ